MSNLNDEDNQKKKVDPLKKEDEKELNAEEKLKDVEEKLLRTLAELETQRKETQSLHQHEVHKVTSESFRTLCSTRLGSFPPGV